MKVKIYQATLTIDEKLVKLTKAIARQFPVLDAQGRWRKIENGDKVTSPICKVNAETIKRDYLWPWLYLIQTDNGLAWVAANTPGDEYAARVISRGGYVDDPMTVPTVIL